MENLFYIGMMIGMNSGYTVRVIMRSSSPELYESQNKMAQVITTLSFPAWISIFIWGFINLPWYEVIIWFLICSLIITPIIFRKVSLSTICKVKILQESLLLLIGILIWIKF